jgi:hypothetical protein
MKLPELNTFRCMIISLFNYFLHNTSKTDYKKSSNINEETIPNKIHVKPYINTQKLNKPNIVRKYSICKKTHMIIADELEHNYTIPLQNNDLQKWNNIQYNIKKGIITDNWKIYNY